ncbi:neurotransmitter:Na+ symporter, NSS family [Pseudidiomarina planktonica]|uniref:Transporter n=2 Tax=Pseudidiomarina planktonica TaxID=1323738 RepID=A0A1Y6ESM6_9GAMM|nr:neurotransmitter:Na+ symporter, NSS family [Pseudidiomarina planktonica]
MRLSTTAVLWSDSGFVYIHNNELHMTTITNAISSRWSSRLSFILASTAAAVGLGNIWKFPYITGENGGGAFVLVYLVCILLIGIPVMIAEVVIGRRGRHSPGHAARVVAKESGRSSWWQSAGWLGMLTGFLVLSFYTVIAGWALAYVFEAGAGTFSGASTAAINDTFMALTGDAKALTFWQTLIVGGTVLVVGNGVKNGLERSVRFLLPAMIALLMVVAVYAGVTGDFQAAVNFMFAPDFSRLTVNGVMIALGHAFFTLGLASGVVIMYGAYLPKSTSVVQTTLWIAIADTFVALLAGLAIFPIVFGSNLIPGAGPGLIFQTLPVAFSTMPAGILIGTTFFVMLVIAAFTSAIAMIESAVAFLSEQLKIGRWPATLIAGTVLWLFGQLTVYSFSGSSWAQLDWVIFGKPIASIFEFIDYLTSSLLLPLGGLLLAVFVGWVMQSRYSQDELDTKPAVFRLWLFCVRWLAPIAITLIFLQLVGVITL